MTRLTLSIEAWHSSKQYQLRVNHLHSRNKIDGFILFRETITLYSENHTKQKKYSAEKMQTLLCWSINSWHIQYKLRFKVLIYIIIIIINIKDWTLWYVPSPELKLFAPTLLRSSNCSPSLWSVVVWFQRDSVLWHSLQVWKPVPSLFIYLV